MQGIDNNYEALMQRVYSVDNLEQLSADEIDQAVDVMGDCRLYIENVLKIQDKRNNLVPFVLNQPQVKLYNEIMRQKTAGIPVRIIILKARQLGFSTAVSGVFYYDTVSNKNTNSAIIAHKNDISTSIFRKMKLFFEETPALFRPQRKASNARELIFENPRASGNAKTEDMGLRSQIVIESAVNKTAFRGTTIHNLHLSELAFWPYPEETMTSALQAVPAAPGTSIIIESTARGIGGAFYDEWVRAMEGKSEYVPLFFPWYECDEYALAVPEDFEITPDEQEIKDKYNLTDEQLAWRRWCISTNCRGDINQFRQEYPSEWHEAFIASGRPVFDTDVLDLAIRKCIDPEKVGRVLDIDGKSEFKPEFNGRLKIWEQPEAGVKYVIGVDSSSGDRGGDPACMAIYKGTTREQVAEWHGFMPPDILGMEAVYLAKYYNNAFIIPEANNHGVSVLDSIKRMQYWRIFRRTQTPDNRQEKTMEKYGFYTSAQSKKMLIDNFAKFVREDATKIKSKEALNECITYVYDDNERSNAQTGCHDDRVIAHALAVYGIHVSKSSFVEVPYVPLDIEEAYGISSVTGF